MNALENDFLDRIAQGNVFARASEAYDMPVKNLVRLFNTYLYSATVPVVAPEETETAGKRSQQKIGEAMARLGERWRGEYLKYWDRFDLRDASKPELLAHLDETVARFKRPWEIQFAVSFPMTISMSAFEELYRDLLGSDGAFDAYRLLGGLENKTVETARELWRLSRRAVEMPEVRKVLEENAASDVVPALVGSAQGREFLARLDAYLDEYGHRGDLWGISYPTRAEDPTPAIKMLKDFMSVSGPSDFFPPLGFLSWVTGAGPSS